MAVGRGLRHAAKKLEALPLHKIMSREIFRQQRINFLIGQFTRVEREPSTLYLYLSHFIHQYLVGTIDNPLEFHLRTFALRFFGYQLGAHQVRTEKADAVQMHLLALRQFLAHGMRQRIEHSNHIRLRQRTIFLYTGAKLGRAHLSIQPETRMKNSLFSLLLRVFRIFIPIKLYCHTVLLLLMNFQYLLTTDVVRLNHLRS